MKNNRRKKCPIRVFLDGLTRVWLRCGRSVGVLRKLDTAVSFCNPMLHPPTNETFQTSTVEFNSGACKARNRILRRTFCTYSTMKTKGRPVKIQQSTRNGWNCQYAAQIQPCSTCKWVQGRVLNIQNFQLHGGESLDFQLPRRQMFHKCSENQLKLRRIVNSVHYNVCTCDSNPFSMQDMSPLDMNFPL